MGVKVEDGPMTSRQNWKTSPRRNALSLRRQTIGEFSRAVGLSPSVLRQYGSSGLLPPADVESSTGYRYYIPEQQQRAIWIRRLREAGLELAVIRRLFETEIDIAETLLDDWISEMQSNYRKAQELADDLKMSLRAEYAARCTLVRCDAAVLSEAIRQVMRASGMHGEMTNFEGVLLEVTDSTVTLSATDRYVLLARTGIPAAIEGPPRRAVFEPDQVIEWLKTHRSVVLELAPSGERGSAQSVVGLSIVDQRQGSPRKQVLRVAVRQDRYPSVSRLLPADSDLGGRLQFLRSDLLKLAEGNEGESLIIGASDGVSKASINQVDVFGTAVGEVEPRAISKRAVELIVGVAPGESISCDVYGSDHRFRWSAPAQPDFVGIVGSWL